jgi:hypothetical protein
VWAIMSVQIQIIKDITLGILKCYMGIIDANAE